MLGNQKPSHSNMEGSETKEVGHMETKDLFNIISAKDSDTAALVAQAAIKYNCSVEKVYWTIRSVYGDKLKNLKWKFREPSKDEFETAILFSSDSSELRKKYMHINQHQWVGIFDRVMGVSTFCKAKELALLSKLPTKFIPVTDNNMAMWSACRLGDGSYNKERKSWKIEHCHWQRGWLEKKVAFFSKSFPQVSTKITHNEKRNTFSWYSCKIGEGKYHEAGTCDKYLLVKNLNAFGLWFLFLDDGCYYNGTQQLVSYAVENMEIATALGEHLNKMGHPFRVVNKHNVTMTGIPNIIKFFKEVLEPFQGITPECMKYKTTYVKI